MDAMARKMSLIDRWIKPFCVLVVILFLWFMASTVCGATTDSVCRIYNELPNGVRSIGSGTLVETRTGPTGQQNGLVLTCHHLFSDGAGSIICEFPDGRRHYAKLLNGSSREMDLAALEIGNVRQAAVPPVEIESFDDDCTACGFGGTGKLKCIEGPVVGRATSGSQDSIVIGGENVVRSGDSGGGVFNKSGQLVGVIWGAEKQSGSYATYGRQLTVFLKQYQVEVCRPNDPNSACAQQGRRYVQPERRLPTPKLKCDCKSRFAELDARLALVDSKLKLVAEHNRITTDLAKAVQTMQAEFTSRIAALESREPQIGPPGQDGKDGRDGTDAVVDVDAIANSAAQIVLNQHRLEQKPFHIRAHKDAPYTPVKPGQFVTLIHGKQE